jgi:hypothetical protein
MLLELLLVLLPIKALRVSSDVIRVCFDHLLTSGM